MSLQSGTKVDRAANQWLFSEQHTLIKHTWSLEQAGSEERKGGYLKIQAWTGISEHSVPSVKISNKTSSESQCRKRDHPCRLKVGNHKELRYRISQSVCFAGWQSYVYFWQCMCRQNQKLTFLFQLSYNSLQVFSYSLCTPISFSPVMFKKTKCKSGRPFAFTQSLCRAIRPYLSFTKGFWKETQH